MTAVKMLHVSVSRHFAAHVKLITMYDDAFWAILEFIIMLSLVVKLSMTMAPDLNCLGPLA